MASENVAERDGGDGDAAGGGLTDAQRRAVSGFIATGAEMSASSGDNPIASQINETHVADIVGLMGKELEYKYIDRQRERVFWGIMAMFAIVMMIAFSVFIALLSLELLLFDLAKGAAVFLGGMIGGLGAGYGLAKRREGR